MVAFGHTAVGSLIGLETYILVGNTNPELGLLVAVSAGLVSHYICDFAPHGHFIRHNQFKSRIYLEIIFNLFLSIALVLGLIYWHEGLDLRFWYVLFGIAGAQLPDVLDGLIYTGFLPKKGFIKIENNFHQWTHWHSTWKNGKLVDGLSWEFWKRDIWQVLIGVATLAFLFWL